MGKYHSGQLILVKKAENIHKVKILESTQTSYKIKYENGYEGWKTINDFESDYILLEVLDDNLNISNLLLS